MHEAARSIPCILDRFTETSAVLHFGTQAFSVPRELAAHLSEGDACTLFAERDEEATSAREAFAKTLLTKLLTED